MVINCRGVSGRNIVNIYSDRDDDYDRDRCYELTMIRENAIPVFLECAVKNENEREVYEFDALSMISLKEYSDRSPLNYDELCIIVNSLAECRQVMRDYLLTFEGLIMDPDYIFYDRNNHLMRFCFYPWNTLDTFSSYTKLTEFILMATNYDDEMAVKLAYEMYAAVLNKDYNLEKYIETSMENENTDYEDVDDSLKKEEIVEEIKHSDPEKPPRFTPFSALCLLLFVVVVMTFIIIYVFDKKILIQYLSNIKVMTASILIISLLMYFPIMNIVDVKCYLVTRGQL